MVGKIGIKPGGPLSGIWRAAQLAVFAVLDIARAPATIIDLDHVRVAVIAAAAIPVDVSPGGKFYLDGDRDLAPT